MRTASGFAGGTAAVTTATAGAGTVVAQEDDGEEENGEHGAAATGNEEPDYEGWLDDVDNYDQTEDLRGEDEVTVEVGVGSDGHRFGPPAIWIDPGTTVVWEWTGEGGTHNVITEEGPADLSSELTDEAGATYEYTFEEGGINDYYCDPHLGLGMKGSVAVGDDIPTVEVDGGGAGAMDPHDMGVQIQEHWVGVGSLLMLSLSIVFTFFVLKYGESSHASHGGER